MNTCHLSPFRLPLVTISPVVTAIWLSFQPLLTHIQPILGALANAMKVLKAGLRSALSAPGAALRALGGALAGGCREL
eukprot:SAG22_NODE_1634_length_3927_cov_1.953239_3_plen_78_part_00